MVSAVVPAGALFLNSFYERYEGRADQTAGVKNIELAYTAQEQRDHSLKTVSSRYRTAYDMISNIHVASLDGSTMYFKPSGDNTSAQYYANQIATVNEKLLESQEDSVSVPSMGRMTLKKSWHMAMY